MTIVISIVETSHYKWNLLTGVQHLISSKYQRNELEMIAEEQSDMVNNDLTFKQALYDSDDSTCLMAILEETEPESSSSSEHEGAEDESMPVERT